MLALTLCASLLSCQPAPEDALPRPTPAQLAWHDAEVGMFIHFAPNTWQDREYDNLSTPTGQINPASLDTDQWAQVAHDMGATYVVFVAKHAGGFCWWPTSTTDYSLAHTPWKQGKGDVMADLARSCAAKGLKLGVYLSPQDIKHGAAVGGKCATPEAQTAYQALFRTQLTELLSNYGTMFEVWFDGSLVFDVSDILSAHAPNAIVFQGPQANIRWVGNEDGIAPDPCWNGARFDPTTWGTLTADDATPGGDRWLPSECDARIRNTWFWNTHNEKSLKTLPELVRMYEHSVGRGAVLLLNHTPDTTGRIPRADHDRAREFGKAIAARFGTCITDTSGKGATIEAMFSSPRVVGDITIMEDVALGERVRAYRLETLSDGTWTPCASGTAIGHKRIHPISPTRCEGVRLVVTESVGEPIIRRLAAHAAPAVR